MHGAGAYMDTEAAIFDRVEPCSGALPQGPATAAFKAAAAAANGLPGPRTVPSCAAVYSNHDMSGYVTRRLNML
jgi:hypothetical protein